jgi:phosphoribosylformimino-5-aminoimidazole carboxamide ribotide isomerase
MITIIPAIDIIDGKCVRLTKGDYNSVRVYGDDPAEMARRFEDVGCTRIHVVDLDGAKSKHIVNYRALERIATQTGLTIDFGGGLKSDDDLRIAFDSGAALVTAGSIAVTSRETVASWVERFGADRIILGADVRNGKISTSGWTCDSDIDLIPFKKSYLDMGVQQVISTDINQDGTLSGPSIDLYKTILADAPDAYVIASGGVSAMRDVESLDAIGVPAVIVGKAIYEGRISFDEIQRLNLTK